VVGQDFGDQPLDITVFAYADDGHDHFDFDADPAVVVNARLHTTHYRVFARRANRFREIFAGSDYPNVKSQNVPRVEMRVIASSEELRSWHNVRSMRRRCFW
jgi:hypothetical protein